jgi:hypothetical protein
MGCRLLCEAQGPKPLGLLSYSATFGFVKPHRFVPFLLTFLRRLEAGLRLGNHRFGANSPFERRVRLRNHSFISLIELRCAELRDWTRQELNARVRRFHSRCINRSQPVLIAVTRLPDSWDPTIIKPISVRSIFNFSARGRFEIIVERRCNSVTP